MKRHTLLLGLSCVMLAAFSGCVPLGDYYTVPWWKGVPCSIIAPSSLEAIAWQEQHRNRRQPGYDEQPVLVGEAPTEVMYDMQEDQ